jgi:hypothetical protein
LLGESGKGWDKKEGEQQMRTSNGAEQEQQQQQQQQENEWLEEILPEVGGGGLG